jgi:GR25 family glycosyltransferase involved in LPS biosynthesis
MTNYIKPIKIYSDLNIMPSTPCVKPMLRKSNQNTRKIEATVTNYDATYLNKMDEFCNLMNVTKEEVLTNPKQDFRYFCYTYLDYIRNIQLPIITQNNNYEAVLVEFRCLPHVEFLIRNCIDKLGKDWSQTIVCGNLNYDYMLNIVNTINRDIKVIKLEYDNLTQLQYSDMLMTAQFWKLCIGEKILIYQEDTCIFKYNIDDFLEWDYIGAPFDENFNHQNGGLSLRTKSIMIKIIEHPYLLDTINCEHGTFWMNYNNHDKLPEDIFFTRSMDVYKLGKLSPCFNAKLFSCENNFNCDSFGMHCYWLGDGKSQWKNHFECFASSIVETINIHKFVINLECTPKRYDNFIINNKFTNVNRFNAINGKTLTDITFFNKPFDLSKFNNLTAGEIGVFLSHLKLYELMTIQHIGYAVIMEDDIIFSDNFDNKYNECMSYVTQNNIDIFYLAGRYDECVYIQNFKTLTKGKYVNLGHTVYANNYIFNYNCLSFDDNMFRWDTDKNACCYIISLKYAKKLLGIFLNELAICLPFDFWIIEKSVYDKQQIYSCNPLICHSLLNDSTSTLSCDRLQKEGYIPKNIYICHNTYNNACTNVCKWEHLNPDYKITIFNDEDCLHFLINEYPIIISEIYKFIKDGPIKSDFFRLCILNSKGGIYCDSDIVPLASISSFADFSVDLITCYIEENETSLIYAGNDIKFNPHFIMSKSSDPYIRQCLLEYVDMYINNIPYSYLSWSITRIFSKTLSFISNYNHKYVSNINNHVHQIQLLNNIYKNGYTDEYCEFNKVVILKNRDTSYNSKSHSFLKMKRRIVFIDITDNSTSIDHHKINQIITGASELQYYKLIDSLSNFYSELICYNIRTDIIRLNNVTYKPLMEIMNDNIECTQIIINRYIPNIHNSIYNKIKNNKMFVWCHDLPHSDVFQYDYTVKLDETLLCNSIVNNTNVNLVFVSNFCKNKYNEYFKNLNVSLNDDRQFVVYNILYDKLLYKSYYTKNKYMITYASAWNKGLYKILEMFQQLLKINNKYRLHLMTPGYETREFKNILPDITTKFGDNVVIHGKCTKEKYSEIITKSICMFAPNFNETFGCVFAEAYYLGTNVIFDVDSGAVNEIVSSYYQCNYTDIQTVYNKLQEISIDDQNVLLNSKFMYKNIISQILKILC